MDVDMDARASFGAMASPAADGRARGRSDSEQKFLVYNDALLHAATCKEPKCTANEGRCHKVKVGIDHFVRCYGPRRRISPIESCPNCGQIWSLLCFHAKSCTQPLGGHCIVAQCDYLREKIARKQQQDQTELSRAQSILQSNPQRVRARSEPTSVMWPVERRIAQVEADRAEVLAMLQQLRAEKAQRQAMMS